MDAPDGEFTPRSGACRPSAKRQDTAENRAVKFETLGPLPLIEFLRARAIDADNGAPVDGILVRTGPGEAAVTIRSDSGSQNAASRCDSFERAGRHDHS